MMDDLPFIDYFRVDLQTRNDELGLAFGTGTRSNPLIIENVEQWLGLHNKNIHSHYTVLSDDFTFDTGDQKFKPFKVDQEIIVLQGFLMENL